MLDNEKLTVSVFLIIASLIIYIDLTYCILVDPADVICWKSPFFILGVSGLLCCFYSTSMENPVSKQSRP